MADLVHPSRNSFNRFYEIKKYIKDSFPADRDELGSEKKRERGKSCRAFVPFSELPFITHPFSGSLAPFLREVPSPNETIKV